MRTLYQELTSQMSKVQRSACSKFCCTGDALCFRHLPLCLIRKYTRLHLVRTLYQELTGAFEGEAKRKMRNGPFAHSSAALEIPKVSDTSHVASQIIKTDARLLQKQFSDNDIAEINNFFSQRTAVTVKHLHNYDAASKSTPDKDA